MSAASRKKPVLFRLAAEGVVPVVGGCAGALAGGVEGGLAGVAVANIVEKAINLFGRGIVERWQAWFAHHTPEQQAEALSELVSLSPAEAREQARELLLELAPDAAAADLELALDYLSAIPGAVDRVLVSDGQTGKKTLPLTVSFDDPESLIRLLPVDLPPYHVPTDLAGTPYRLEELLGAGGFGAVYRASAKTLQHLPLAIKFCLDRGLLASLQKERANLERLMKAANDRGAEHVVRLYGYDLDHATPYLVYEYVPGGDLTRHLAELRHRRGRPLNADEVLDLVRQTANGLAFAHRHGLVHRDVKPANVLVRDGLLKLADFGLGGVAVTRAVQRSRIGLSTIDYLSLAEQASLFRGAGTPLYMSPEQRRGANPDPRHDLYSLGVMWFQLLIGDVTRELHPGWAKELKVRYAVPPAQIELIERCVGWYEERPTDANELLALMTGVPCEEQSPPLEDSLPPHPNPPPQGGRGQDQTLSSAASITPRDPVTESPSHQRQALLRAKVKSLADAHETLHQANRQPVFPWVWGGLFLGLLVGWLTGEASHQFRFESEPFPAALRGTWDWYCVNWGLAVGVAVWFVAVLLGGLWRGVHAHQAKLRVAACVAELHHEFPGAVAAWGGRSVLETEDTALAVGRAVARGDDPAEIPARTLAHIEADPELKARFNQSISRFIRTNPEGDAAIRGASGWFVASWFLGPVLGAVIGFGVAGIFMLFPATKHESKLVTVVGGLAGVGTAGGVIGLLRHRAVRVAEDVLRDRAARVADAEREYGPALRSLGSPDLLDQFALAGLVSRLGGAPPVEPVPTTPDPMRQEVLIGRLKEHYQLLEARDEPPEIAPTLFTWVGPFVGLTIGGLLFAAGLATTNNGYFAAAFLLGGGGIGGSLWLGRHLGRKANEELQVRLRESRESLERDYAVQLADWGGAELLSYKVAVGGVIRKLGGDPDW